MYICKAKHFFMILPTVSLRKKATYIIRAAHPHKFRAGKVIEKSLARRGRVRPFFTHVIF